MSHDRFMLGLIATLLFKEKSQNRVQKKRAYLGDGGLDVFSNSESSEYATSKGWLFSLNYNFDSFHQMGITSLYNHTSEDTTNRSFRTSADNSPRRIENLNYIENSLLFNQIHGQSFFRKFLRSKLNWDASYSRAIRYEPDRRRSIYLRPSESEGALQ